VANDVAALIFVLITCEGLPEQNSLFIEEKLHYLVHVGPRTALDGVPLRAAKQLNASVIPFDEIISFKILVKLTSSSGVVNV
jgi:hypothetical protein